MNRFEEKASSIVDMKNEYNWLSENKELLKELLIQDMPTAQKKTVKDQILYINDRMIALKIAIQHAGGSLRD